MPPLLKLPWSSLDSRSAALNPPPPGTFEGSVDDQAAFVREMGSRVDVVVVVVSMMAAKDDSDEVWMTNVRRLMELTGGIPLGLYECPAPYHRCVCV